MSGHYSDLYTAWQALADTLSNAAAATLMAGIAGMLAVLPLLLGGQNNTARSVAAWPFRLLALPIALLILHGLRQSGIDQPLLLTLAIVQWPCYLWSIRTLILSERRKPYIEAAVCLALGRQRIVFSHLLPNCGWPLLGIFMAYLADALILIVLLERLQLNNTAPSWIVWRNDGWLVVVPVLLSALVLYWVGRQLLKRYARP